MLGPRLDDVWVQGNKRGKANQSLSTSVSFLARLLGAMPEGWGKRRAQVQRDTPEKTLTIESQGINPLDPREHLKVVGEGGSL